MPEQRHVDLPGRWRGVAHEAEHGGVPIHVLGGGDEEKKDYAGAVPIRSCPVRSSRSTGANR